LPFSKRKTIRRLALTVMLQYAARSPFQRMEPKVRHIEFLRPGGYIQPRQHAGDFVRMLRVDRAAVVAIVKAFQAAMPKMQDHPGFVVTIVTC
jgi:hypothetical protein